MKNGKNSLIKNYFYKSIEKLKKSYNNIDINSNIDWSKSIMGFVSHRCVPLDDNDSSYYKSKPAFLDSWIIFLKSSDSLTVF